MARRSANRTRAAAGTAAAVPELRPDGNQVLIRMYGQGLGDCFLLAFRRPETATAAAAVQRPVYVLIDCGVILGTPNASQRMKQIVRDIRATTRDDALPATGDGPAGHLDLLIVTHEHWDHLSGFVYADEEWAQIQVDALWTAWTEEDDPDGLAGVLQRIKDKQRRALAEVADRAVRFNLEDRLGTVLGLMSFLSDAPAAGQGFAAAGRSLADALATAKGLAKGNHVCCEPGEVRPVPGTDAVAYVLGPPQNWERLSQMDPSSKTPETFQSEPGLAASPLAGAAFGDLDPAFSPRRLLNKPSPFNAFVMPLLGPALAAAGDADDDPDGREDRDIYDRSFPFDRSARVPLPTATSAAANLPATYPALASYFDEINHWRRIDFDWLMAAEGFALAADNLVNNTSLVLAIELPAATAAERKVLLFVADAQVGNWLSWDEITAWRPRDGATTAQTQPDVADLLKRTVFYKVGHHGSHNATLKAKGVERMPDDGRLTAFVPVSVPVAREIKGWSEMPLEVMLNALSQRAGGRVVLPDGNVWPPLNGATLIATERDRIGVEVAPVTLPAKVRDPDGEQETIEHEVPLWVQIAIDY